MKKEVAEGMLQYDRDDGYCLEGDIPGRGGCRVGDLFHKYDGKRIRITIEVVDGKGNLESGE